MFGIKKIIDVLKNGGLVVMPSDTVYGLAVDATNKTAVKKLLGFKERWPGKAISVFVSDFKMAKEYALINKESEIIYSSLIPGPFTLIVEGKHKLAKGIEAEDGSLGIRIPDNKFILDLVIKFGKPITATSANLSGRKPHYSIDSFLKTLSKKKKGVIDLIVDEGKLPKNKPSTVIDIREPEIKVLRRGELIAKNSKTFISKSLRETQKIADYVFEKNKKPIIFGLSGDLGTGKTIFSQEIGKLAGVKEKITSPTYVTYNDYGKFLHMDLYKINNQNEIDELELLKIISEKEIVCIEWIENLGDKNFKEIKKENNLVLINFEYVDEKTREIKL